MTMVVRVGKRDPAAQKASTEGGVQLWPAECSALRVSERTKGMHRKSLRPSLRNERRTLGKWSKKQESDADSAGKGQIRTAFVKDECPPSYDAGNRWR